MPRKNLVAFGFIAALFANVPAIAGDATPLGLWQRDSGSSRVRIAPCGDRLCGTIVWVRDNESATRVGMRVLYDMQPERPGNWTGKAFNPTLSGFEIVQQLAPRDGETIVDKGLPNAFAGTELAIEVAGTELSTNMAMIGSVAGITKCVSMEALDGALQERFGKSAPAGG